MNESKAGELFRVGLVRSQIKTRSQSPRQGTEGAPDAWVEIGPEFLDCLDGIKGGDDVILLTWLHESDRSIHKVHPRGDKNLPIAGVFATRSPDRPNPVGLHRVRVLEVTASGLKVKPLEALDGTPVIDIKPVLHDSADS